MKHTAQSGCSLGSQDLPVLGEAESVPGEDACGLEAGTWMIRALGTERRPPVVDHKRSQ